MRVAIIGSGNIGTDLLFKVERSPELELALVVGIDPESEGLAIARERGHAASSEGIDALLALDEPVDLVFDATSAAAHLKHAPLLEAAGVRHTLDLTPAAIGPFVFPTVNLEQHLERPNLNLVSCAAQATIPLIAAVTSVTRVRYAETVSTVASRSAGPGTRANIDEFTHKTTKALQELGGAERGKGILLINPADPPLIMRNTMYLLVDESTDQDAVLAALDEAERALRRYAPGYRVRGRALKDGQVTIFTEVEGSGDYLPAYAGNLDIITAAAVAVAEEIAKRSVTREGQPA